MVQLNTTLPRLTDKVMNKIMPAQFSVTLTLVSADGSWRFAPLDLDATHIRQDFISNFTDDVIVTFKIAAANYHTLYQSRQGLRAILKLSFLDAHGSPQLSIPPIVKTYVATLVNPHDVSRTVTNVNLRVDPDMETTLKLFEPDAYRVRHESVSGIYRGNKLDDIIGHLANAYGLSKVHITATDNDHTWDHVLIPAYKQFKHVFDFLQHQYGVYYQGLTAYFTEGYLWVYPPFDTNPLFPTQVKIYQAKEGSYAGSPSFHTWESSDVLSVVSNHRAGNIDRSINDSENTGTAVMFTRASPEVDGIVSQNSGVLTYNQDTAIVIRRTTPNLTEDGKHFMRYAHQTDNIQHLTSHLAEMQHIETTITWDMAVPFQIKPGQLITYYSDENGKTVSRTGQVSRSYYKITRASGSGRINGKVVFECQGYLTLRLSPTAQVVSST